MDTGEAGKRCRIQQDLALAHGPQWAQKHFIYRNRPQDRQNTINNDNNQTTYDTKTYTRENLRPNRTQVKNICNLEWIPQVGIVPIKGNSFPR